MDLWKRLDPKTPLFQSSAFVTTALLFGGAGIIFATANFLESDHAFDNVLSKSFFEYLYTQLKIPTIIAGISLPILGLIASHLRSMQTAAQIESQQEQNTFTNHLAHRTHFNDFFEKIRPFGKASTYSSWEIYESIFPFSPNANFNTSTEVFDLIEYINDLSIKLLEKTEENKDFNDIDIAIQFASIRAMTSKLYGFDIVPETIERELPTTYKQELLTNLQVLLFGMAACSNFHQTQVDGGFIQNANKRFFRIDQHYSFLGRCERIAKPLNAALSIQTITREKVKKINSDIAKVLNNELESLRKTNADTSLDILELRGEVKYILENLIPEDSKTKAKSFLPNSLTTDI